MQRMSLAANGKTSPSTGTSAAAIIQNWTASQQQRHHTHQQQQQHQPDHQQSSTTTAGRRLLPSPVLKQESEKARNVRLLLAKHQEQVNQLLQLRAAQEINASMAGANKDQTPEIPVRESSNKGGGRMTQVEDEDDEDDLQFLSARLPGNSFPATSPLMLATSMSGSIDSPDSDESDDQSEEDKELLKRLRQGQARMEQIKRMLVNQRGFIVESLRQLAQSNSDYLQQQQQQQQNNKSEPGKCSQCGNRKNGNPDMNVQHSMEQDRTLGRTYVDYADRKSGQEPEQDRNSGRLCPMCEAVFPVSVSNEDFEMHVMEHFNFDDSETMVYVPQDSG